MRRRDCIARPVGEVVAKPLGLLLSLLLLGTGPVHAQPAPSELFEFRIEEIARALEDNPRFKGLSQQERIDRVEFVVGNTLFVLLHEMGHMLINEMRLPVLAREEDAADTFAALRLIRAGSLLSQRLLIHSAKGWFFSDRRDRQTRAPLLYYDDHGLNRQRAYQIVCLMVGSDPVRLKNLADETKLPPARRESCKQDYERASWSWDAVLAPHSRAPDQPSIKIDVVYGEGIGVFDGFARSFRAMRLLETVAEIAGDAYVWPAPITLQAHSCNAANAGWDSETRTLKLCYQLAFDFLELYTAYGGVPLLYRNYGAVPLDPPQRGPALRERKTTVR
jgi:hypothetical protein